MTSPPLLCVDDLRVHFHTPDGTVRAVDGLSFDVEAGEAVGLVGESGCGKSVTSLALLRLIDAPGEITGGRILWRGQDLLATDIRSMRGVRGREIGLVFQEPTSSLNPVLSIGSQIAEVARELRGLGRREARAEAIRALEQVGIADATARSGSYPHELSGGMCQRAVIAAALIGNPALLVADEPTTALDLTTQSRILALLDTERRGRDMALLLVSHDLDVVGDVVDRVIVMYAGRACEMADTARLFEHSAHPYTRGLLASRPRLTGKRRARLGAIPGGPVGSVGCPFSPRCPHAADICRSEIPVLREVVGQHLAACHLLEEIDP